MKKVLLEVFILFGAFQLMAQEETSEFKRWQARLRLISVIPDESANIGLIRGDISISTVYVYLFFYKKLGMI